MFKLLVNKVFRRVEKKTNDCDFLYLSEDKEVRVGVL